MRQLRPVIWVDAVMADMPQSDVRSGLARPPGSEITGPAFTTDGSRLYFSSQRGPNVPGGQAVVAPGSAGAGAGATYEIFIPRSLRD